MRQLDELGIAAVRPAGRATSTRSRRRSPRAPTSTSASSRSTSAARRWCAPRPRTTRASPWSPTRPATRRCSARCDGRLHSGDQRRALAARAFAAHRRVRRGGRRSGVAAGAGAGRRTGWPEFAGLALTQLGGAAVRREPAPAGRALRRHGTPGRAGPGRAAARQGDVATTTTSTPTPPGGRPTTSPTPAVAIIKHANPCGIAVGARRRRGAPQGARLRPGVGVRRRDRGRTGRSRSRWPGRSPRSSPR